MKPARRVIALEGRLRRCRNVRTLGVRPNFMDYSPEERRLILASPCVYYPSSFYAGLLAVAGRRTFPGHHTYRCVQDKIRQTALFQMTGVAHPRTRVFYGRRQQRRITEHFEYPFVAKAARGSAMGRGVYLIRGPQDLAAYCRGRHAAYIQEYLPMDRDMRVVVIGGRVVHAYWRLAPEGGFLTNLSAGGRIGTDPVPQEALELARQTARRCRWDDVGVDICYSRGRYWVLEGNMKYGRQGFRHFGIDYDRLMESLIEDGRI